MIIWNKININSDYLISDDGRVRSIKHGKIKNLKLQTQSFGYKYVGLFKNGVRSNHFIHRLVAIHFIPNPKKLLEVNHINGIKSDNRAKNLEWVSSQENIDHSQSKPIIKFDSEGNPIHEYKSITSASLDGFSRSSISDCCHGKRKSHKGFIWKFKN